jgi:hypothetical protein
MRDDIRQIIEKRSSWILMNDSTYHDLNEALEIATKERDYDSIEILKQMIEERKQELLK